VILAVLLSVILSVAMTTGCRAPTALSVTIFFASHVVCVDFPETRLLVRR
jgi:hypothetical protein